MPAHSLELRNHHVSWAAVLLHKLKRMLSTLMLHLLIYSGKQHLIILHINIKVGDIMPGETSPKTVKVGSTYVFMIQML